MQWYFFSIFVCAALSRASPANDWSKPCFEGECAYDLLESTGHSGALRLSGPHGAITDITPAAGWVVLDCDAHALEQEIRLVCSGGDHDAAGCAHLFDNGGPLNRVVRLPERCSAAPFLRIADARVAEDQSIPHHSTSKVSRRGGLAPVVHILRVDANWAAVDASQVGTVAFDFSGTNSPIVEPDTSAGKQYKRNADLDFSWLKKAWNAAKTWVSDVNSFNLHPQITKDAHFESKEDVTVYELEKSKKPDCSQNGVTASLKVIAGGQFTTTVKLGLTAHGSIIPPTVGSFAVYSILDADVDAHLQFKASVLGHLQTDRKKIGHVDLTPLEIPGIIALGPAVELQAYAELDLDLEVDIDTRLKYKIDQMEFWYPKQVSEAESDAKSGAKLIQSLPAPISLSAAVNVTADVNITAHLVPQLQLGLSVANGAAVSLDAFIEADIWARAKLHGEVSAAFADPGLEGWEPDTTPGARGRRAYIPPYLNARAIDAADDTSVTFKGCFGILAGVVIRAGAQGSLATFQSETDPWVIWTSDEYKIYSKCWGKTISARSQSSYAGTSLERRKNEGSLKCGKNTPKKIADDKTQNKRLR